MLTELYDLDEEAVWLNNAIYLLLQSSESSADFNRPLFTFNLNCSFAPLLINQMSLPSLNRQQPVTSSMALLNQIVISASQAQMHKESIIRRQQQNQGPMGSLPSIREEDNENADVEMVDESALPIAAQSSIPGTEQVELNNKTKSMAMLSQSSLKLQSSQGAAGSSSQNSNHLRVVGAPPQQPSRSMINTGEIGQSQGTQQ